MENSIDLKLRKTDFTIYIVTLIVLSIVVVLFIYQKFIFAFVMVSIPLLVYTSTLIFKQNSFLFLIFMFYFLAPQTTWYDVLPPISYIHSIPFFLITCIYTFKRFYFQYSLNRTMLLFLVLIFFGFIKGFILNYSLGNIVDGAIKFVYYPLGFFFIISLYENNKENFFNTLKKLLSIISGASIILSLYLILLYLFVSNGERVLTRQGNIILVGVIISIILFKEKHYNILKSKMQVLSIITGSIAILVTMQRSLWLAYITAVFTIIFLDFFKKKRNLKDIMLLIIIVIVLLFSVFVIFHFLSIDSDNISDRTSSISEGKLPPSLIARIMSYMSVIKDNYNSKWLGKGIGRTIVIPLLNNKHKKFVDNSLIVIWWKMGFIGLIVYLCIIFKALKNFFRILRNTENRFYTNVSIIGITILISQMLNGLGCVVMIHYHYNFIWGVLIGISSILIKSSSNINNHHGLSYTCQSINKNFVF